MDSTGAGFLLALPQDDAARAVRVCGLRARAASVSCTWYDTPAHALADAGMALGEWRGGQKGWRLERLWPADEAIAPPGAPPAVLAEAPARSGIEDVPEGVRPVAGFSGRRWSGRAGEVSVLVLAGTLRAAVGQPGGIGGGEMTAPCCRVMLEGPGPAVTALAVELAGQAGAQPAGSLAAAVLGGAAPARSGAPDLPPDSDASSALTYACAHLTWVIVNQARPAAAGLGSEPVHQMRVAIRRLRSVMKLFAGIAPGPELAGLSDGLKALARALGQAREWDVFLSGLGHEVAEAFPGDKAVDRLLAAAQRQREAAYAALRAELEGVAFRQLCIRLSLAALTRPWEQVGERAGEQAGLEMPALRDFAARALDRRWRRLLAPGRSLDGLEAADLHAVRLRAKRLRYAAELFAPLWPDAPASRFMRRVAAVQDRLGHLNDGASVAGLMAALGAAGQGRAGGIIEGFVAAHAAGWRARIDEVWRKLRKTEPFWG